MSHMNNLHALTVRDEHDIDDMEADAPPSWVEVYTAEYKRITGLEPSADATARMPDYQNCNYLPEVAANEQTNRERCYGTPYVRVYMPNNLPQPTPPIGYTITRAALRTDGRLGTLHSDGKTLDEAADRMAEHFDDVFILSVEAEGPTEDGTTGTQYSEWKVGRQGGKWSEWQWL